MTILGAVLFFSYMIFIHNLPSWIALPVIAISLTFMFL